MKKTQEFISKNTDRFLAELFELLRIPSVSADPNHKEDVQKAAENVKDMCEKVDLTSRNVHLANTDPGALIKSQVETLKERLYG